MGLDERWIYLDLFVKRRKFNQRGKEVFFYGYNGFDRDGVAKGWLRVSHRATVSAAEPTGKNAVAFSSQRRTCTAGRNRPVEIQILASNTLFEAETRLQVDILGHDADRYPGFQHISRPRIAAGIPYIPEGI